MHCYVLGTRSQHTINIYTSWCIYYNINIRVIIKLSSYISTKWYYPAYQCTVINLKVLMFFVWYVDLPWRHQKWKCTLNRLELVSTSWLSTSALCSCLSDTPTTPVGCISVTMLLSSQRNYQWSVAPEFTVCVRVWSEWVCVWSECGVSEGVCVEWVKVCMEGCNVSQCIVSHSV